MEFRERLPDSSLVGCTLSGEIGVKDSNPFSLAVHHALEQGSSTPEPLVSLLEVHSAGTGKSNHETFATPMGTSRVFTLCKAQEERKLADLVDPEVVPLCEQAACALEAAVSSASPVLSGVPLVSLPVTTSIPEPFAAQTAVAVTSAPASTPSAAASVFRGGRCRSR